MRRYYNVYEDGLISPFWWPSREEANWHFRPGIRKAYMIVVKLKK